MVGKGTKSDPVIRSQHSLFTKRSMLIKQALDKLQA
jgi:hypothetical protein